MTDSEAGEVTSSTDVGLVVSCPDDVTAAHQEPLEVDGITSTNALLQVQEQGGQVVSQEIIDNLTFAGEHQVTMDGLAGTDEGYAIINADHTLATSSGHVILTTDGMLPTDGQCMSMAQTTSLQSLLAAQGNTSHLTTANGETIQIITVANPADLTNNKLWQVVPDMNNSEIGAIIINPQDNVNETGEGQDDAMDTMEAASSTTQVVDMVPVSSLPGAVAEILMPPPTSHPLPPGCPAWAARLKDCQKIGDAYRGWVESEVELDLLLTYHKQQTGSFWGTRQSPSPAKQSTRLMWKSQYVPFDGIPFINSGSRAIVMECQYGPRRKGAQAKRMTPENIGPTEFKQTCPARIYIKKVRKFPEFGVDINIDKKTLKIAMDKSFQMLKERGTEAFGQERFYVQLPTEASHEFHSEMTEAQEPDTPRRLHPRVGQKIRDVVSSGESRLYAVRKALRRFVERELFDSPEAVPEKHNLTFYPTVNDLQNHIHQALRDVQSGLLPTSVDHIRMDGVPHSGSGDENDDLHHSLLTQAAAEADGSPHAETVTVTLTQHPGEDGQHIISRVETHLSDGSTQVSTTLTQETAQLLAKLHPNMFPAGSLLQESAANKDAGQELAVSSIPSSTGKVQTVTLMAHAGVETKDEDHDSRPDGDEDDVLESDDLTATDPNLHTLQIIHPHDEQNGDMVSQTFQGIQILDSNTLSQHGVHLVQQGGGLPAGLQFITADGELTDAQGQPIHLISGVTGQGISLVQHDEANDVAQCMGDVDAGLDGDGVITIAMAPDNGMIKTEELVDGEVVDELP